MYFFMLSIPMMPPTITTTSTGTTLESNIYINLLAIYTWRYKQQLPCINILVFTTTRDAKRYYELV